MSDASSDANKALTRQFFERISAGDLSAGDEFLSDDYVEHEQVPDSRRARRGYGSCSGRSTLRSTRPILEFFCSRVGVSDLGCGGNRSGCELVAA
jgi:ketosteroid isomerase-like protein